ncbi:MAG TPA: RNase adapter RapZ [Firmicutes bacterium]|nr:RNase adapter RapZ [Bacillota bacterium]
MGDTRKDARFVIITGLSGAGKTEAIRSFEDLGFFCVDNLPPTLIPKFADLVAQSEGKVNKIALVVDIRGGKFFDSVFDALANLGNMGIDYEILFLDASNDALVRRFKETRRRHPLSAGGSILDGIMNERGRLEELKARATRVIDTSNLTARQLRERIVDLFGDSNARNKLNVVIVSFGFKHGVPLDADLMFDVRFLPNPHYVEELRPLTGDDEPVREYVLRWPVTRRFLEKLFDMISFLIPYYIKEGKAQLVIGIGCTGGRHRSVAIANKLAEFLRSRGFRVSVEHRDRDRGLERVQGDERVQRDPEKDRGELRQV